MLWLGYFSFLVACFVPNLSGTAAWNEFKRFEPNWASLDKRTLPEWYGSAKIGIFLHWGVYSVPSFGSEWFWTYWKNFKSPQYVDFMQRNYKPNISYQHFASEFNAELFNATQWALLFRDSGAKYTVLVSKHHDGYCLWPSKHAFSWNSMDIGPGRDLVGEVAAAIRKYSTIKFGVYYSLFEWFNRLYIDDKKDSFQQQSYVDYKMRPELLELIESYRPEILWSDGDWDASDKYWKSEEFLAWLYNESPVRDTIVTNDRWGRGTACKHGDFYTCQDRYNPGILIKHKWENALTLDLKSWGQRFEMTLADVMSTKELITQIVSTISCNGNVLINIGPTKYGTILPIFEERLRAMGQWLRINGAGIYKSVPWLYQNDTFTSGVWYTSARSNASSELLVIYAFVLDYPYETNELDLHPLGKRGYTSGNFKWNNESNIRQLSLKQTKDITLLGMGDTPIKWNINTNHIHVVFPPKQKMDKRGLDFAWTFKITLRTLKLEMISVQVVTGI